MKVLPFSLVAGALVACGQPGPTDRAGETGAPANMITELPLERGFYVMNDSACGNATNATLLLIRSAGMNGSRDACDFESIEQTGSTIYRAVMTCRDTQGRETGVLTNVYEIPDRKRFSYGTEGSDYRADFRYCEQSSLPDPWRDIDLGDVVASRAFLREMLDAKSPLYFADQVQRPLFIAAGANDVRVPISQNDRFVEAARDAGVHVEYLVFEDEGHGFRRRTNRIRAVESYVDFLDHSLDRMSDR